MSVKRYGATVDGYFDVHSSGDYVKHTDYAAVLALVRQQHEALRSHKAARDAWRNDHILHIDCHALAQDADEQVDAALAAFTALGLEDKS